ncbi:MAG: hypothetical protein M0031_14245 [Thermaerobacter sp.]|nr:hypothetical protein [Thermaerobacter sp.]
MTAPARDLGTAHLAGGDCEEMHRQELAVYGGLGVRPTLPAPLPEAPGGCRPARMAVRWLGRRRCARYRFRQEHYGCPSRRARGL